MILDQRNKLSTTKKIVKKIDDYLNLADKKEDVSKIDFDDLKVSGLTIARKDQIISRDLSFSIRPGEKIAIIGASGSGKSTLLQFLMYGKFGEASNISLNGKEVAAGQFADLFAYASQKAVIFADDLWFNLTLGADISRDEVDELCKKLDLEDLIQSKEYEYSLGDNADQLSGGQLARIDLARSILSKRPVLLLDEINASLDHQTDQDIHDYLFKAPITFIEVIHHYDSEDLKRYDRIINLS